jgi:hypothetical protein
VFVEVDHILRSQAATVITYRDQWRSGHNVGDTAPGDLTPENSGRLACVVAISEQWVLFDFFFRLGVCHGEEDRTQKDPKPCTHTVPILFPWEGVLATKTTGKGSPATSSASSTHAEALEWEPFLQASRPGISMVRSRLEDRGNRSKAYP